MNVPIMVEPARVPQPALAFLHDRIVQIVSERSGIKETDLTMDIMADLLTRDQFYDPITEGINTEIIFLEIHHMIQTGRIMGVDLEIGDRGYTFLVPAGTNIRLAVPVVPVKAIRTTH